MVFIAYCENEKVTKSWDEMEQNCNAYVNEEPNPKLRSQIINLLSDNSEKSRQELESRMGSFLTFGTAGLRGRMEAGYNRMNAVTVYRLSHALCTELDTRNQRRVIVIGFDGRERSHEFALLAARIMTAMGASIHMFSTCVPTPLCAYATRKKNADSGVMITASHNPAYDNGIKLYNRTGAQENGAILKRIEQLMKEAPLLSTFTASLACSPSNELMHLIDDAIFDNYLADIKETKILSDNDVDHAVNIVYTPLHGVGKQLFFAALSQEGFTNITVVPDQAEPNGAFPTVDFPNPEEAHTLDRAHELARSINCSWVFANDPDADRLQVSCPDEHGRFKRLSGNEMGALLAHFSLMKAAHNNIKPLLASSIVSSRMVQTMCKAHNAYYVDALTGFSNIINVAKKTEEKTGAQFVFGYEEAIGFLVGDVVLDKDGINAGARFMEIAGYLKKKKRTVWQLLDDLYLQYGMFVNTQWSLRFDGALPMESMAAYMNNVRAISTKTVAASFSQSECQKLDLTIATETGAYAGLMANVVIFEKEHQFRLIIRPSGTEPKIKFYFEVFDRATDLKDLSNKRTLHDQNIVKLKATMMNMFG